MRLAGLLLMLSGCYGQAETGLRVERVEPWGAAAAAGIEAGDVIESWRTANGGGVASNPLELLWLEQDAARAPVTLVVRRGWRRQERFFEDAGWAMATMPALPEEARATYERAAAGTDPGAWEELERLAIAVSPKAGAWAAWRRGVAVASEGRIEEAAGAFQQARDLAGSPVIAALLQSEEGQAYWYATYYRRAGDPWQAASSALRQVDARSPALGQHLIWWVRYLVLKRQLGEAGAVLDEVDDILRSTPRAETLRVRSLVGRGNIAWLSGDLERAEEVFVSALRRMPESGDPYRARINQSLSTVLREQGEYEEAFTRLREGLAVGSGTPQEREATAGINNSLGLLSKRLGNYEEAERYYRRALEVFPPGGAAEAGVLNNLGNLALRRGDLELAATYHRESLELRRALQPGSASVASSTHHLGVVERRRARHEEAGELFDQALALKTEHVPGTLLEATTLHESGLNQLALGNARAAEELVSRACEIHRNLAPTSMEYGRCLISLGDVESGSGSRRRAIELWQQGLEIVENLRTRVPSEQGRARFSAMFDVHYRNLVVAYLEDGDLPRAFRTLESARARMLRALLAQHSHRSAFATSPELLEARRRVETRIARSLRRLERLQPAKDADRIRELKQRLQGLESEREELNERLYQSVRGLERIEQGAPISIERIRAHLPEDSVGLLYMLNEPGSHVFVVHPASGGDAQLSGSTEPGLDVVDLPLGREEVARRIDVFRGLLERGRTSEALEPALVEQGSALFDALLAPVADHIGPARRLFISPDHELVGLPFAALIRSRTPLTFVAEWRPHAVVPSLTSLVELREQQADRPAPDVEWVGIGAPEQSGQASERARDLGALPGSRREIETLSELFDDRGETLIAGQATEAAARGALPRGRYLHFATHALLDRRFPMSSSLVLSSPPADGGPRDDGLMHGWEIFELPALAAELVTLAGCETGRGAEWAGEGLIGLAQAFHYVGTPAILASQWRVGDAWVGTLTEAFYRELLAGHSPMDALAAAQRRLITSTAGPESALRHPFYWAAFTLFGVSD